MDLLDALQLRAGLAVLKPDREAWIRYVCRRFSKEFNTPLDAVYDLPLEFVITNYFEAAVEEMDEEQRHEYMSELVLTDPERARLKGEAVEAEKLDDTFLDKLSSDVKAGMTKGPPKERKKGFVRKLIQDEAAREHGKSKVVDAAVPLKPAEQPTEGADFRLDFGSGGNLLDEMGSLDPLSPRPRKKVL